MFDGMNIWVSDEAGNSIKVVRAVGGLRGTVMATLTENGLNAPNSMAFDGERVLVCNGGNNSVSLFKAADFTPLSSVSLFNFSSNRAYSDGLHFFISGTHPSLGSTLVRF
jgi:hypothetical protein